MNRRQFLAAAGSSLLAAAGCRHPIAGSRPGRLLFTSDGRTAMICADGSELRPFDFRVPGQATWQPGPILSDGRIIFLSMEPRRDGPGRPFEEFYTQTPTHLWLHDPDRGTLTEIADRERLAVFYTPALLLGDERILVQVVRNKVGQIFSMNLDGTDAREFTRAVEGLPYGLSLSPDGRRVAFHLASPRGYEIWTCAADGSDRIRVAGDPEHLYFGTSWSPDGRWVLYQDCHFRTDPGHDWSDVCVGRPDGTENRILTRGQIHWFGATYGGPQRRGGGSNLPVWTRDGQILFSRRSPDAKVPWEFQPQRPDTDHFNRDYRPQSARGGAQICRLDPANGAVTELTPAVAGRWDCRAAESPDGRQIVFCRAATGEMPSLWVMDQTAGAPRQLTQGLNEAGADHPRWVPLRHGPRKVANTEP